jgi:thiol-disulfide isomerase/thioredoxin
MNRSRSHRPSAIGLVRRAVVEIASVAALVALSPFLGVPGSVSSVSALHAQETGLPVGSKAPTTTLVETLDGKPFDLGQFVGKTPVLIEFWATWCPNCKQLEPAMVAAAKKYGSKVKFVAVAVSVNQSPERVKLYAEKHALPLEMYFDKKGNAADAYDAAATSYIVILDKTGTVVYTGLGGSQDLDAAIRKAITG